MSTTQIAPASNGQLSTQSETAPTKWSTLPPGITPEDLATPDEAHDLDGVNAHLRRVKFDGQTGVYNNEEGARVDDPSGRILGVRQTQVLFTAQKDSPAYAEDAKWNFPGKWLCRAPDRTMPPILHPELTEDQQAEVLRRRGGQRSCVTCPLSKPKNGERSACNGGASVLFVNNGEVEPYVLQFPGSSARAALAYMATQFKKGQIVVSYWKYVTALASKREKTKDGDKAFSVATLVKGEETPSDQMGLYRDLRLGYWDQMVNIIESGMDAGDHPSEPASTTHEAPPVEVVRAERTHQAAPPASSGQAGGLTLDEDGNPVIPDAAPVKVPF